MAIVHVYLKYQLGPMDLIHALYLQLTINHAIRQLIAKILVIWFVMMEHTLAFVQQEQKLANVIALEPLEMNTIGIGLITVESPEASIKHVLVPGSIICVKQ